MAPIQKIAEQLTDDLASSLDIPDERYESAERSYKSVGNWLQRNGSRFSDVKVNVYTQGSFRLGTAIRPVSGNEDYDVDVVCEFALSKRQQTQQQLHDNLGEELKAYARAHGLKPPDPWRRCWTMNYADSAQFHMDIVASVPDADYRKRLRELYRVSQLLADASVGITDSQHASYRRISDDWPISNPNGYANWFYDRMKVAFETKRRALMLMEKKASIADIPEFRVKAPLQAAVQILKRHRDLRFVDDEDLRPSSILLTTLAAHSYDEESTILGALESILARMDTFIERRNDRYWVANPSDPRENFADSWNETQQKAEAFFDWLDTARTDFQNVANSEDADAFLQSLAPRMGRELVEKAITKRQQSSAGLPKSLAVKTASVKSALRRILDAPHKKPLSWPVVKTGYVFLSGEIHQDGFRPRDFVSDSAPIPPGKTLFFSAKTNIPEPFRVFWQVVNTGDAARKAHDLRGRLEEKTIQGGGLTKKEKTRYSGTHSIECFIVKNDYCVASSGPFLVNIA